MKFIHLAIIACLLILVSCKKDEKVYEVIYPGPYFPVYPNSWWKYMNQDSVISYHYADQAYRLNKFIIWEDEDKTTFSDPCYVPFYDGQPIYGYDKIDFCESSPFYTCYKRWPLLSEQTGFAFERKWVDHRYVTCYEIVGVMGKYFNGKDTVLVQKSRLTPCPVDVLTFQEYAKNIGLIRQFSYDTITCDTVSKIWLIDYHVSFDSTSIDYQ
jgi:hypothetical protein